MRNSFRGDLVKQLRRPSDFYRGHLAEDYDGIGQYILVSMSRGSTAAALRARIAAGDFGGGRTFPVGTPVVMHSHHGQLEVLSLGNIPSGCILIDEETFGRVKAASDNWGVTEFNGGQLWTPISSGDTSMTIDGDVTTGKYTDAFNRPSPQELSNFNMQLPIDAVFRARMVPTANAWPNTQLRLFTVNDLIQITMFTHISNTTLRYIEIAASDNGVSYLANTEVDLIQPNTWYTVRTRFGNDTIKVRAWKDGETEPTNWLAMVDVPSSMMSGLNANNKLRVAMAGQNGQLNNTWELDFIRFYNCGGV